MKWTQKLLKLMDARNENQSILGDAVGVTSSTVGRWLNGSAQPKLREMVKLAEHYGITLDQLFRENINLPDTIELRVPANKTTTQSSKRREAGKKIRRRT